MSELTRMEAEIAATRDRLSGTIDRIQDKLTVTGIIDEVMGSTAVPNFNRSYGNALGIVRRNPIPVLIIAAGIGLILQRLGRAEAARRMDLLEAETIPVVNDGRTRIYDPDLPTDHLSAGAGERLKATGFSSTL